MDIENLYESNPKMNKSDVEELEKWMETQPHLPKPDERMLVLLLNSCELDVEKTKTSIESYYSIRTSFPAVFSERDPEIPMNVEGLNVSVFEPFPQLTPEGHVVFYNKLMDTTLENFDFCVYAKILDMRVHAWLRKFGCCKGIQIIIDMEGMTFKHWQKFGFLNARKMVGYLVDGFPMCLKNIHYVNPNPFINAVLALMLPLVPSAIKQCIQIHSGLESLHEVLPKYCIPNELNGTGGSIEKLHQSFIETIKMNRDYFIDDEQYKTDESKRIRSGILQMFGL